MSSEDGVRTDDEATDADRGRGLRTEGEVRGEEVTDAGDADRGRGLRTEGDVRGEEVTDAGDADRGRGQPLEVRSHLHAGLDYHFTSMKH